MKNNVLIGLGVFTALIGIGSSFAIDIVEIKVNKNILNTVNALLIGLGGALALFGLSKKLDPEEYDEPDDFEEF